MSQWKPGQILQLETENYRLRSLTAADATDTYVSWWNDAEVQDGLGQKPRHWGRREALRHIGNFDNRQRFHLGIFPGEEALPIGFIAIFLESAGCAKTNTVIGNKAYWGRRVVLEVRARVLRFLFEDLRVFKVHGQVDGRNFASVFNYKAQGFTCEGVLRQHAVGPDGNRRDLLNFGLLREEWIAAQDQ